MAEFNPREHVIVKYEKYYDAEEGKYMLRKKEYLAARDRIRWARQEHPDWRFISEVVYVDPEYSVVRVQILDAEGNVLATALYDQRRYGNVHHPVATAETLALGRALSFLGYGTEYLHSPEHEEGEVCDSPVITETKIPLSEGDQGETSDAWDASPAEEAGVDPSIVEDAVQEVRRQEAQTAVQKMRQQAQENGVTEKGAEKAVKEVRSARQRRRAAVKKAEQAESEQKVYKAYDESEIEPVKQATGMILRQIAAYEGTEPKSVDDFAQEVLGHPIFDYNDAIAVQTKAGELLQEISRRK